MLDHLLTVSPAGGTKHEIFDDSPLSPVLDKIYLDVYVKFQGKPPRESTALSGGEKTMAATVFILALQSLKPSPFYLMDEVDAHLDAQNTERLSKIMVNRFGGSQILMVTLKESNVAKATQIFGIYPKSGASQIVHYRNQTKYR